MINYFTKFVKNIHNINKFVRKMCTVGKTTEWRPSKYIGKDVTHLQNYAIMLLNRPIIITNFDQLWNNATIRHAVDGGLNHFLNYKEKHGSSKNLRPPDIVSGDFDSCLTESLDYATRVNCNIIHTPDQNETDFTKGIRTLSPLLQAKRINNLIVVVETCDRIDQIFANINTLFKANNIVENLEIMIISSISLAWLISTGTHVIYIPKEIVSAKIWCGLIPFRKTIVTTTGLKWDLDNSILEFGGMVSTSNTYKNNIEFVKITTDYPLLWTMGISLDEG